MKYEEFEVDEYKLDNLEAEVVFKRYFNRFLTMGVGVVAENQKVYVVLIATYNQPGNIEMESYIKHDKNWLLYVIN